MKILTTSQGKVLSSNGHAFQSNGGSGGGGNYNIIQTISGDTSTLAITDAGGGITLQEKTAAPTTTSQEITADAGYTGLSKVTVEAIQTETKSVLLDMSDGNQTISATSDKYMTSAIVQKPNTLIAENIKKDIVIGGITGTYTGSGGNIPVMSTITVTNSGHSRIDMYYGQSGSCERIEPGATITMQQNMIYFYNGIGDPVIENINNMVAIQVYYAYAGEQIPIFIPTAATSALTVRDY